MRRQRRTPRVSSGAGPGDVARLFIVVQRGRICGNCRRNKAIIQEQRQRPLNSKEVRTVELFSQEEGRYGRMDGDWDGSQMRLSAPSRIAIGGSRCTGDLKPRQGRHSVATDPNNFLLRQERHRPAPQPNYRSFNLAMERGCIPTGLEKDGLGGYKVSLRRFGSRSGLGTGGTCPSQRKEDYVRRN